MDLHGADCHLLAAAHVVAQDLFVTIPATPTKNPLKETPRPSQPAWAPIACAAPIVMAWTPVDPRTRYHTGGRRPHGRGALFNYSQRGPRHRNACVSAPRTSDMDVWRILAHLKTMAAPAPEGPPRGNAGAGENVFAANCMGCHRVGERGGNLDPTLADRHRACACRHGAADSRHRSGFPWTSSVPRR